MSITASGTNANALLATDKAHIVGLQQYREKKRQGNIGISEKSHQLITMSQIMQENIKICKKRHGNAEKACIKNSKNVPAN